MLINLLRPLGGTMTRNFADDLPKIDMAEQLASRLSPPESHHSAQWRLPFVNSLLASTRLTNNSLQEP